MERLDIIRDLVQHWDAGDIDHDYDAITSAFDSARDYVHRHGQLAGEHRHPGVPAPLDVAEEAWLLLREAHRGDWCQLPPGVWRRLDDVLIRLDRPFTEPDSRLCHDTECFLRAKGVWGHPVSAHETWPSSTEPAQGGEHE